MKINYSWLKYSVMGVLAVYGVGCLIYAIMVQWPKKACDENGQWWDNDKRVCASPITLNTITGRPAHSKRTPEEVSAARAKLGMAAKPTGK